MSVTYESYLCHHGVKGMKWGVRRYSPYEGNLQGWKRHRAKVAHKTLTRLNEVSSNSTRGKHMSLNQRQSLKNAKKYWTEVEKTGKYRNNSNHRGIVKRHYDKQRSRSIGERVARSAAVTAGQEGAAALLYKKFDKTFGSNVSELVNNTRARRLGREAVHTAYGLGVNEVVNKMFGHF